MRPPAFSLTALGPWSGRRQRPKHQRLQSHIYDSNPRLVDASVCWRLAPTNPIPMNSLTREAGIKIGPLLLETAVKHYFERILKDHHSQNKEITRLRQDELLYDEAFNIVKVSLVCALLGSKYLMSRSCQTFLEASTK